MSAGGGGRDGAAKVQFRATDVERNAWTEAKGSLKSGGTRTGQQQQR